MMNPFTPAGTVNVSATTSSDRVELAAGAIDQVMVTVPAGDAMAFVEFGDSTVVATAASSTPVLPGAAYIFTVGPATHMAAITAASTATVYATGGQGE